MKRRIISPIPPVGIGFPPATTVVVDQHYDYLEEFDGQMAAPPEAIYVATQDEQAAGTTVVKDDTNGKLTSKHSFSGWKNPKAAE